MAPEDGEFDGRDNAAAFFHPSPLRLLSLPWQKALPRWEATSTPSCAPLLAIPHWGNQPFSGARLLGCPRVASSEEALRALTGNQVLAGSTPLGQRVQRPPVRRLGGSAGRRQAILLGELAGAGHEIQLKALAAPYSRMGDGRHCSALQHPRILCSEAMHGWAFPHRGLCASRARLGWCGVRSWKPPPSSPAWPRALCALATLSTLRPTTRKSSCGTLADYVIDRYYPECRSPEATSPWGATLRSTAAQRE